MIIQIEKITDKKAIKKSSGEACPWQPVSTWKLSHSPKANSKDN